MSEKIYACLLRLYPREFRETYGEEALQVFRDRAREEKGFPRTVRLWLDLVVDLAISLPREYRQAQPVLAEASARHGWAPLGARSHRRRETRRERQQWAKRRCWMPLSGTA
jgi:hypothetical protein